MAGSLNTRALGTSSLVVPKSGTKNTHRRVLSAPFPAQVRNELSVYRRISIYAQMRLLDALSNMNGGKCLTHEFRMIC
jgi:hypothetical protein